MIKMKRVTWLCLFCSVSFCVSLLAQENEVPKTIFEKEPNNTDVQANILEHGGKVGEELKAEGK